MSPTRIWSRFFRYVSTLAVLGAVLAVQVVAWPGVAFAEEPTVDEIDYDPSELPPDGARSRLFLVGAALTVGWYGASVGTSYLWQDAPNSRDLRLPIVGPWLALGDTGCGAGESGCSTWTVVGRTALAIVSGVGQLGGVLALTEGIFMSTGSGAAAPPAARGARHDVGVERTWAAIPVALPNGAGVEFVGRF